MFSFTREVFIIQQKHVLFTFSCSVSRKKNCGWTRTERVTEKSGCPADTPAPHQAPPHLPVSPRRADFSGGRSGPGERGGPGKRGLAPAKDLQERWTRQVRGQRWPLCYKSQRPDQVDRSELGPGEGRPRMVTVGRNAHKAEPSAATLEPSAGPARPAPRRYGAQERPSAGTAPDGKAVTVFNQ